MRRQIHVLSTVTIILSVFPIMVFAAGGDMGLGTNPLTDGSESYPWLIEDIVDFHVFAGDLNYWDDYTLLYTDVNLTGITYTSAVIAPDTSTSSGGFQGTSFTGVFDGNSHVISNLTIDTLGADNSYLGLFGKIDGAGVSIKNLGMEGCNILGGNSSYYLGCICGWNNGSINNCYAIGVVNGPSYLGGLCGRNDGSSSIRNCYANVTVTGGANSWSLGGLCGYNYFSSISNCYATGTVNGGIDSNYLGGLCGENNSGSISNSYATCEIMGGAGSGSLGGLCGENSPGSINNCYFLDPADGGGLDNGIGVALLDTQMRQQNSFVHWDFVNETSNGTSEIWQMPTGGGYPELSIFNGYIPVNLSGDGSGANPYLLSNAAELGAMYHYNSNACFRLQADINLAGIQWSTAVVPTLGGCFEGNNYTIYNLNIEGGSYLGLFGRIEGSNAEVKNLSIKDCNIIGGNYSICIGGLCGDNYQGTIAKCYSTGLVTTGDNSGYIGGLAGGSDYESNLTKSYSNVTVIAGDYSGHVGGLVGYTYIAYVGNCYATGHVTSGVSSYFIGGLIGYNIASVNMCYAIGQINVGNDSSDVGGLIGENYPTIIIDNCFWDTDTSGVSSSDGGTGKTTLQMKTVSTFQNVGWDLVSVWNIEDGQIYPLLRKYSAVDTNFDHIVNLVDLAIFAENWLEGI